MSLMEQSRGSGAKYPGVPHSSVHILPSLLTFQRLAGLQDAGESEMGETDMDPVVEENVFHLDVPVDHVSAVEVSDHLQ